MTIPADTPAGTAVRITSKPHQGLHAEIVHIYTPRILDWSPKVIANVWHSDRKGGHWVQGVFDIEEVELS